MAAATKVEVKEELADVPLVGRDAADSSVVDSKEDIKESSAPSTLMQQLQQPCTSTTKIGTSPSPPPGPPCRPPTASTSSNMSVESMKADLEACAEERDFWKSKWHRDKQMFLQVEADLLNQVERANSSRGSRPEERPADLERRLREAEAALNEAKGELSQLQGVNAFLEQSIGGLRAQLEDEKRRSAEQASAMEGLRREYKTLEHEALATADHLDGRLDTERELRGQAEERAVGLQEELGKVKEERDMLESYRMTLERCLEVKEAEAESAADTTKKEPSTTTRLQRRRRRQSSSSSSEAKDRRDWDGSARDGDKAVLTNRRSRGRSPRSKKSRRSSSTTHSAATVGAAAAAVAATATPAAAAAASSSAPKRGSKLVFRGVEESSSPGLATKDGELAALRRAVRRAGVTSRLEEGDVTDLVRLGIKRKGSQYPRSPRPLLVEFFSLALSRRIQRSLAKSAGRGEGGGGGEGVSVEVFKEPRRGRGGGVKS